MKIHINKEKRESKGLFGFGQTKTWFTVEGHYELNDEEKQILNKNRDLLSYIAVDWPYTNPEGRADENSHATVQSMTDEKSFQKYKGHIFGCVFSYDQLSELENLINEGAKNLKSQLMTLKDGGGVGSSVTEI